MKFMAYKKIHLFLFLFPFCFSFSPSWATTLDPIIFPPGEIRAVFTAEAVNQDLINQGRATAITKPFMDGTAVYEIRTARDLYMVRTYLKDPNRLKNGAVGSWLMNGAALRGKTPAQAKDLFALPALNDYLTTVKLPAGTILRTGSAGPIIGWGDGGGQQILLITRLTGDNYEQQRTLVNQSSLLSPLVNGSNAMAVASYLDNLPSAEAYSDKEVVQLMIGYLSGEILGKALTQISPERYDSLNQIDIQNSRLFLSRLMDRRWSRQTNTALSQQPQGPSPNAPDSSRTGSSTAWSLNQGGFSFWGESVGTFGRQDSSREHTGFTYQTGGMFFGTDFLPRKNLILGAGLGLARTGFYWDDTLGDGNINSLDLGLYGGYTADPFFLDGALSSGLRKAQISRRISFPGVDRIASGFPDGYKLGAGLKGGFNMVLGDWRLQPLTQIHLFYIAQDVVRESGAGDLNLNLEGYNSWTWRGEVGLTLSRTFIMENRMTLSPELRLGWGRQTALDNREIKAYLTGCSESFLATGYNGNTDGFMTMIGVRTRWGDGASFFLGYQGEIRSDFLAHAFNAVFQFPF
jgi:outer membrane autotransporter protein